METCFLMLLELRDRVKKARLACWIMRHVAQLTPSLQSTASKCPGNRVTWLTHS